MIVSKDFRYLLSGKEVPVCLTMRSLVPMKSKGAEKRIWADIIITLPRFGQDRCFYPTLFIVERFFVTKIIFLKGFDYEVR